MSHPCSTQVHVYDLILDHKPNSYEHRAAVKLAKEICATCPLTGADGPCAQAMWDEPSFAGGLTREERARITQPRGRLWGPRPLCKRDGCEDEAMALGDCRRHYRQTRREQGKGNAA